MTSWSARLPRPSRSANDATPRMLEGLLEKSATLKGFHCNENIKESAINFAVVDIVNEIEIICCCLRSKRTSIYNRKKGVIGIN